MGSPYPTLLFRSGQGRIWEGFRIHNLCCLCSASSTMLPPTAARAISLNFSTPENQMGGFQKCRHLCLSPESLLQYVREGIGHLHSYSAPWNHTCKNSASFVWGHAAAYTDDPHNTIRHFIHSLIHSPVYLHNQLSIHPLTCK